MLVMDLSPLNSRNKNLHTIDILLNFVVVNSFTYDINVGSLLLSRMSAPSNAVTYGHGL